MKILEDDHCPDCGVELTKVRQGRFGTPCGMFHIYPGIAKLVISVVNNERDDIKSIITGKKVVTETKGEDSFANVKEAVTAHLDTMHEVIFPPDKD